MGERALRMSDACLKRSHHSEIWEVKLFQGQISHLLFEVGFQWPPCSERQTEARGLNCPETCLGDGGGRGLPGDPSLGIPSGEKGGELMGPSPLTPRGLRPGGGRAGTLAGESAWVLVAAPPGKICVTFRRHFPLQGSVSSSTKCQVS